MIDKQNLIDVADAYRAAANLGGDVTVSNRVFGDGKKLAALRGDADITVGRFNAAMRWFAENWPTGHALPDALAPYVPIQPPTAEDAA